MQLQLIESHKKETSLKKETSTQVLPVDFAKFLKTPFLQKTSGGCF